MITITLSFFLFWTLIYLPIYEILINDNSFKYICLKTGRIKVREKNFVATFV